MTDNLQTLIEQLQTESATLQRLIREAVKTGEYLVAHYHAEALAQVGKQLQTLKNIDDKLYEQKKTVRALLRYAQETLKKDYPDAFKKYLEKRISEHNDELAKLDSRGKVPAVQSEILEQHLQMLLHKEVRYVRIILRKSKGFALEIRRSTSGLKVSIPNVRSLRKSFVMYDERLQ